MTRDEHDIVNTIRSRSIPMTGPHEWDPLIEKIADANVVMLGEASHGTHEYYTWRASITKKLITRKNFHFIAVEGDWPDCYEVNRYIKGYNKTRESITDILHTFDRWPSWMWANWEVAALAEWLKEYNSGKDTNAKVGFYGLDVYSLWESMEAILRYLEKVDPASMDIALEAYRCFEPHRDEEGHGYARSLQLVPNTCEDEVIGLLQQIQNRIKQYDTDHENTFDVQQNAFVTVNAEKYYRAMLRGGAASWNVRDTHMAETLERLMELHGAEAKGIVWEHNTHIGDSRATDMADEGMFNIGELARRNNDFKVFLTGFGSYEGTVVAGRKWGARMEVMEVPPARKNSWEYYLHEAGNSNKLIFSDDLQHTSLAEMRLGHRAIGVVYNPNYERPGNYVPSIIPRRYDAFIFIDKTRALHPLKMHTDPLQTPETYPFGV